jgi:hypothetical protein
MAGFGDRVRHARGEGQEKLEGQGGGAPASGGGASSLKEGLSEEERAALGPQLSDRLKDLAAEKPPRLALADWRALLSRTRSELEKEKLSPQEKRELRQDIRALRPPWIGRWLRRMAWLAIAAGVAAALAQLL